MQMRVFGRTGMQLSVLGFGCGAVGGLMVRGDPADQERTIARAIAAGVNYFDTAVQYGNGESEKNLGRVLQKLKPAGVAVGTKVRLQPGEFGRIAEAVTISLEGSLARLRLDHVDIFHLHNEITESGGGSTLSARQVLGEVVPAFERLRQQGKTRFLGITALGDTAALHQVIDARVFDSAQVVYNMLNPSAAEDLPANYPAQDYGRLFDHTGAAGVGVVGIRVLAGGALSGSAERHPIAGPAPEPIGSAMQLRCRCRPRGPPDSAGKGGLRHQPDRSRHAVCAVSSSDGHDPGRHGDAAAVRGRARRSRKRPAAASCARPAVGTAAGIFRRTTMIAAWLTAPRCAGSLPSGAHLRAPVRPRRWRIHRFAPRLSSNSRLGLSGISSSSTPRAFRSSASSIAWANSGPTGIAPASPAPLMPSGIERRRRHRVGELHARHFQRRRQQIVGERGVQQLPLLVEHQLLVERIADALRHAAMDLAGQDQRVDHRAAVVHHDIFVGSSSVKVSGSISTIMAWTPLAVAPIRRAEIAASTSSPGSVPGCTAPRIGLACRASSPRLTDRPGTPATETLPSSITRSSSAHSKCSAASFSTFFAHDLGGLVDGVAGDHRAAAREGAGAPVELVGVAGDDIDVGDGDAELVGGDLGKAGEMALSLRADAGRDAHLAVRLHLHLRALVGADAGAFDVAGDADADVPAFGAQPRLLFRGTSS